MSRAPRRGRSGDDVLMFGAWPDPRAAGICGYVHDLVKGLVEAGRDVLLVMFRPGEMGPDSLAVAVVPSGHSFDWREAVASSRTFRDVRHLAIADSLGVLPGGPDRLADVGVVHAHGDDLLSPNGTPDGRPNRYEVIAALVEARAGVRPVLVRTAHDEVDAPLSVIMSLSGVDYVSLPDASKRAVLDGELDLMPLVTRHVAANRDELRAALWTEDELDHATDYVAFYLQLMRRWRREMRAVDAVVSLTERGAREREAQLLPDRPGVSRFVTSGTSFRPGRAHSVRGHVARFREEGLLCLRAASDRWERVRFAPGERVVLFVGRPSREKGIYELAEALRRIYHVFGFEQVRGVFAGGFPPETRASLAAVDPEHAEKYLFFAGYISDPDVLASLYALADVLALPTYYETFGLVGVEGLLMGTPCVVTGSTSAADAFVVRPGREGLAPGLAVDRPHPDDHRRYWGVDVDSLARQTLRLVGDDALARRMGAEGRAFARNHYTERNVAEGHLRLYDELLGARTVPSTPPVSNGPPPFKVVHP